MTRTADTPSRGPRPGRPGPRTHRRAGQAAFGRRIRKSAKAGAPCPSARRGPLRREEWAINMKKRAAFSGKLLPEALAVCSSAFMTAWDSPFDLAAQHGRRRRAAAPSYTIRPIWRLPRGADEPDATVLDNPAMLSAGPAGRKTNSPASRQVPGRQHCRGCDRNDVRRDPGATRAGFGRVAPPASGGT